MHKFFFFFNDTATTEIYTLSLHDALPICMWFWYVRKMVPACPLGASGMCRSWFWSVRVMVPVCPAGGSRWIWRVQWRSEEHTSELQSRQYLVCRLLLEKKK